MDMEEKLRKSYYIKKAKVKKIQVYTAVPESYLFEFEREAALRKWSVSQTLVELAWQKLQEIHKKT